MSAVSVIYVQRLPSSRAWQVRAPSEETAFASPGEALDAAAAYAEFERSLDRSVVFRIQMENGDWESLALSAARDRSASTSVIAPSLVSDRPAPPAEASARVEVFSLRSHWARVETRRDETGFWRAYWCLFGRKDDAARADAGDMQRFALVAGITGAFQVECDARLYAEADASVTEGLLVPRAINVRMCAGVPTSTLGMSSPLVQPRMTRFVCTCDDYDYRIDWIHESDYSVHWSAVISYDGQVVGWPTGRVLASGGVDAVESLLRRAMQDTIHAGIEAFAACH